MKPQIFVLVLLCSLIGEAPVQASTRGVARAKAAKGPVQISFHLDKTKVKQSRSLWFRLELKNIGKEKLRVEDLIFKDPWALHENCRYRKGIYFEIIGPDGKPLDTRFGGGRVRYDWEPLPGETRSFTAKEREEIAALQSDWKRRGLTAQQQSLAMNSWVNDWNNKKKALELSDPAKQLWLAPGASTATFAWADRGPGEYAGRAEDDAALTRGYTQLWSYEFFEPGIYRIRAVYDRSHPESNEAHIKKYGRALSPWWVAFKTPFIEFEVLP